MKETEKRWLVVATYFTDSGEIDVEHFIEELLEIHDIIERGPSWYTLKKISIYHNRDEARTMTIEESMME